MSTCMHTIGRIAATAAIVLASHAVMLSAGTPAMADVPGHVATMAASARNSDQTNFATAKCPAGKVVVGGGGYTEDGGHDAVRLTRMQPVHTAVGDNFLVEAAEPAGGVFIGQWRVVAIAICANPLPGYQIVSASTDSASPTFVATLARCPAGKLVTGTGARVVNGGGEVWLQLMRSSGPRDIARATAREDANGQDTNWSLTAYAICADPIPRTVSYGGVTDTHHVNTVCDPGLNSKTLSVGGGGGLVDSGPVWLTGLYIFPPGNNPNTLNVSMTGLPEGGMAWGGVCSDW